VYGGGAAAGPQRCDAGHVVPGVTLALVITRALVPVVCGEAVLVYHVFADVDRRLEVGPPTGRVSSVLVTLL